jgi:hypothetical protein
MRSFRHPSILSSASNQIPSPLTHQHAEDLKARAAALRLEADQMYESLRLSKISALERRLNNTKWVDKNEAEMKVLIEKLQNLKSESSDRKEDTISSINVLISEERNMIRGDERLDLNVLANDRNPVEGFTKTDLSIFLPVALSIEKDYPDCTTEEKLAIFREHPDLQKRFEENVQEILAKPMRDMQEIESLRQAYLSSSSSVEKDSLKRQIEMMETKLNPENPGSSTFFKEINPMSDAELQLRVQNLEKLPTILQSLFMHRNGMADSLDLTLGVLVEHFDEQLYALDQVQASFDFEISPKDRKEIIRGFQSLHPILQNYILSNLNLDTSASHDEIIMALLNTSVTINCPSQLLSSEFIFYDDDQTEYNDIEYVERSQYIEELLPSICALEDVLPSIDDVHIFLEQILEPKLFGLRSKPERVLGGYYIRGYNALQCDSANDILVSKLNKKLSTSKLAGKVQFFFILDPKSLTDEEIDIGDESEPVLLLTGVESSLMYRKSAVITKAVISVAGIISLLIFSVGTAGLNEITSQMEETFQSGDLVEALDSLNNVLAVAFSLVFIQFLHELAHRIVAWKDKVRRGNLSELRTQYMYALTSDSSK